MEFQIETKVLNGQLTTNSKELVEMVEKGLKSYDYVVTDETYDQAKKDRTSLNKIVKQISDERKRVEDTLFSEWKNDKKLLMDIEKKIKSSSEILSDGIKDVEYQEKEEKKKQIRELWSTISNDKFKFELVFDEKYLNKTSSNKFIEEDLKNKFKHANEHEGFMDTFLPEDEFEQEQVKEVFYNTLDLTLAKIKADELKDLHKKVDNLINKVHSEPQKQAESVKNENNELSVAIRIKGSRSVLKAFNEVLNEFIRNNDVQVEVVK